MREGGGLVGFGGGALEKNWLERGGQPKQKAGKGGGRTKKLATDSEDNSNDVVLAFIASDEEYVDQRPATTRSGRAVTKRAEIDFSFFWVRIC